MGVHVYTSIVNNYLPKARVLAQSIKRFHPDLKFHVILSDTRPEWLNLADEPFDQLMTVEELVPENARQWIFRHTLIELSTAVKGAALVHILQEEDCSAALYLDPDTVVLAPLHELIAEFERSSVLLTPHLTTPETTVDAILDNEFSVLQHGVYNMGFVGVKNSAAGRSFAAWWSSRLQEYCFDDIPRGLFTDQRWIDLAPAYFEDLQILRHPGYNVATWNLTHRHVEGSLETGLLVNGKPLFFYHFSGLDSGAQAGMLAKYGRHMPCLYELRDWYLQECERMGQAELSQIPWAYGQFDNGQNIEQRHRVLYRSRADLQTAFPNPFATSEGDASYYQWFEANERGRPRVVPELCKDAARFQAQPPLRVYVSCNSESADVVQHTVERLQTHAGNAVTVSIVGRQREMRALLSQIKLPAGVNSLSFDARDGNELFDALLNSPLDGDFMFVRAGVDLPLLWDVRLGWTAARQPGVATVIPVLGNRSPLALGQDLTAVHSNERLDRFCLHFSSGGGATTAELELECIYVRIEAVRAARLLHKELTTRSFSSAVKNLRYTHMMATHIYAGRLQGAVTTTAEQDPLRLVRSGRDCEAITTVAALRTRVASEQQEAPSILARIRPRNLHIMHSWGGGLERWVQTFCEANPDEEHLVLKSVGNWGAFGRELHLYKRLNDTYPWRTWKLNPAIAGTTIEHAGYQAALSEIIDSEGIRQIFISSLIGHSLEAMTSSRPTVQVFHDFYPFCPTLNITFEGQCNTCTPSQLTDCTLHNPKNRFFRNVPAAEWITVRRRYSELARMHGLRMVVPSPSVRESLTELMPECAEQVVCIPHGTRRLPGSPLQLNYEPGGRLRIVVLGSLAQQKGATILRDCLADILRIGDLWLIGAGDEGSEFEGIAGVSVIRRYRWDELADMVASIQPHLGLLLSIVPETFSFTLQELFDLAIPTLTTRIGSFKDRVKDGVNGFLCEPESRSFLRRLTDIASDVASLGRVHRRLLNQPRRRLDDMAHDYHSMLASGQYSPEAYFAREKAGDGDMYNKPVCQLFWRSSSLPFAESASAHFSYRGHGRHDVRLIIPPGNWDEFRLDPIDCPALLLFHSIRLLNREGALLWSGLPSSAGWVNEELFRLDDKGGQPSGLTLSLGSDPSWVLPVHDLPEGSLRSGGTLVVDVDIVEEQKALATIFGLVRDGKLTPELSSNVDAAVSEIYSSDIKQTVSNLRAEVEAAHLAIRDVETSRSWRVTAPLRAARARVRELAALTRGATSQNVSTIHWSKQSRDDIH